MYCRIIPARAGFTTHHIFCAQKGEDHPRSRGVYANREGLTVNSGGSSPLARGLPGIFRSVKFNCGIIPARAGFTMLYAWL